MLTLYTAPKTRSFAVLWLLEEIGEPYTLKRLDFAANEHKAAEFLKLNPFGKVPTVTDGDAVLTERAAICTYLADRYAAGRLAPGLDDKTRGNYLRWMFFSVGVMEPLYLAKFMQLDVPAEQAPWGTYETVDSIIDGAIAKGPFILGKTFSAADILMGTMIRWGMMWELVAGPHMGAYVKRLENRPAFKRAVAIDSA
jgi:glutathione S-transferase